MVLWSTTWFCVGGTFLQVKRKPVIGTPADTRRFAGEGIATIGGSQAVARATRTERHTGTAVDGRSADRWHMLLYF
jgi:hypothetical protein